MFWRDTWVAMRKKGDPDLMGSLSDIIQLGAKVKTNPFREVFFEGIDYRKFNFKYKFMPKNKGTRNRS